MGWSENPMLTLPLTIAVRPVPDPAAGYELKLTLPPAENAVEPLVVAPTMCASKDEPLMDREAELGTTRSMSPDLFDPWSPPAGGADFGLGLCFDQGLGQTPPLVSKRLDWTLFDLSR